MSIESMEGIKAISDELVELQSAYIEQARVMSAPAEMNLFALALTRAEALRIFDARIATKKEALRRLGFNKPVIQVTGETNESVQTPTPAAAEVQARKA